MLFLMASASASALKYFLRPASASASASRIFASGFRDSKGVLIKPSFTNVVSISIYLHVPLSPPSARRAAYAFPAPVERLCVCVCSVAGKVFRPERDSISDEFFLKH